LSQFDLREQDLCAFLSLHGHGRPYHALCMAGVSSFPLVPRSPSSREGIVLVPVAAEAPLPILDEPSAEFFARLRQFLLVLLFLLLLAVSALRRLRLELVLLRQQAHYWCRQHQRAKQREEKLQQQVQQLQAQIRDLEKRLYGRKSETAAAAAPAAANTRKPTTRPRGQQRGTRGPSRRSYEHLPTSHETRSVPPEQRCCGACGAPWRQLPGSDDGQLLEIEVRAHRRVYHRQRYERT
jgi:hypothetical protein